MKGSEAARLYTIAITLLVFFVVWAGIAAHPWTGPESIALSDPRAAAVTAREAHLLQQTRVARRVLTTRWIRYQRLLAARVAAIERANGRSVGAVPVAPPPVVVWSGRGAPVAWTRSS